MNKISLVMITKNEEKNLAKSLDSVKDLVSEIVILDSGSTDSTIKIAEKYGAKIYSRKFDDFCTQKNCAMSLAQNEWILHLDADEVLSSELKEEIKQKIVHNDATEYDGFYMTRVNFFLGRKMKHSGISSEARLRLAKKSLSEYVGGAVHERLEVRGKIGEFKNIFYHNSFPNLNNYFKKFDQYTSLDAQKRYDDNKNFYFTDVVFRPPIGFIKSYILKLGFLDGMEGFIWAVLSSYYIFVKYVKFYLLKKSLKSFKDS